MKKFICKNKQMIKEYLWMTFGIAVASFSYSFFLAPSNVVCGGVSGLGLIIENHYHIDDWLIILIINVVLLLMGLIFLGKEFFIKTVYGSIMFPALIGVFESVYDTLKKVSDKFDFSKLSLPLVIVISALLMGYGLGLSIKHGGSTGGVEIPQKILFKYCHIPFSLSLYFIDGTIILLGFLTLNQPVETLLYEIVLF